MRSEKPIYVPSRLSAVSQNLAFETVPMFVWLTIAPLVFWSKIVSFHASLFQAIDGVTYLALCPLAVSQAPQQIQNYREARYLWALLCLPVCLLGHFASLRHVQGSTPTGVVEGDCRPLTFSSLCFPFYFSLFLANIKALKDDKGEERRVDE